MNHLVSAYSVYKYLSFVLEDVVVTLGLIKHIIVKLQTRKYKLKYVEFSSRFVSVNLIHIFVLYSVTSPTTGGYLHINRRLHS